MGIAIGVRVAGVWIALAAITLLAACSGGGGAGTTGAIPNGVTNATISWLPPTESTSGSAVGALGGYKIYYGTASQRYTTTINVSNPGLTTYVIDALEIGVTYYFAVTAISASGIESTFSPEVAATIS
jgi:fibronectin type 3 domain-containing protein